MRRIALAVALLPGLAFAETSSWKIDSSHTHSTFTIRHLVISNVRGEFGKTAGVVKIDDQDLSKSSVEAEIETASINTREGKRDDHLRSPDFFDASKHPKITFKSTKVEKAGKDKLKVTGDLTMHGVTKPVVLEVDGPTAEIKDPMGNVRRGLSARTTLNRKEWGLNWNKAVEAGPVVGDEVKVEIEAELVKDAPSKTTAAVK
jgi:polyisoprenoid-binding protein YceI